MVQPAKTVQTGRKRALSFHSVAPTKVAAVVLLLGLVSLASVSCRVGAPKTAGNNVIWFRVNLTEGRSSDAYDQLCGEPKERVPLSEFRVSQGEAVSPMLATQSWIGTGVEGVPDVSTLDVSVNKTWENYDVRRKRPGAAGILTGTNSDVEHWRIDSQREDGDWKVCRFTRI